MGNKFGVCCSRSVFTTPKIDSFQQNNSAIQMKEEDLKILKESTKKAPWATFKGKYYGKVVSVYDGDTINLNIISNNNLNRYRCRLIGIDSPEIKPSKDKKEKDKIDEKYAAYYVRDHLRTMILNEIVLVDVDGYDKYGRLLVNINKDNVNINKYLIDNNYAVAYDGGTKSEEDMNKIIKGLSKKYKK